MSRFFTKCPFCQEEIKGDTEWIGQEVSCPFCQKEFKLESNQSDEENEDFMNYRNITFCSYCQKVISITAERCPHCNKQTPLGIKNNGMENKKDNCPLCQGIVEISSSIKHNTIILCPYCSSEIYYTSNGFLRKVTASDKKLQAKQEKDAKKSPFQKKVESFISAIFWLFILLTIPFCLIYGSYLVCRKENFLGLFYVGIPILIFSLCVAIVNRKNKNSFFSYIGAFFSAIIITPIFTGVILLVLGIIIGFTSCCYDVITGKKVSYSNGENSSSEYRYSSSSNFNDRHKAWVEAQYYVEAQLKNPRSAKFEYGGASKAEFNGIDIYIFRSYVDATNSFGGTIRTYFFCKLRKKNDNNFELLQLNFSQAPY